MYMPEPLQVHLASPGTSSPSRYIFPGLALGAALGQTGVVTNAMINRAAEVTQTTDHE